MDNQSYKYYDQMGEDNDVSRLDEYDQIDFAIWKNIYTRIKNSAEGSSQRFTQIQKEYFTNLLNEYIEYNTGKYSGHDGMDKIILQSIVDGL